MTKSQLAGAPRAHRSTRSATASRAPQTSLIDDEWENALGGSAAPSLPPVTARRSSPARAVKLASLRPEPAWTREAPSGVRNTLPGLGPTQQAARGVRNAGKDGAAPARAPSSVRHWLIPLAAAVAILAVVVELPGKLAARHGAPAERAVVARAPAPVSPGPAAAPEAPLTASSMPAAPSSLSEAPPTPPLPASNESALQPKHRAHGGVTPSSKAKAAPRSARKPKAPTTDDNPY